MLLSICIPTYNRPLNLANCLNSFYKQKKLNKKDFEICISDNCSKQNIAKVIKPFKMGYFKWILYYAFNNKYTLHIF